MAKRRTADLVAPRSGVILGIDPGSKPGYGIRTVTGWATDTEAPRVLACDLRAIVTEDVWFAPRKKGAKQRASPMSIATLSNTCGRQCARWGLDVPCYRLPVLVWKDAVLYRGASLPKEVFVAQLRAHLRLGAELTADEVEACGLVYAFELLGYEQGAKKWLQPIPS